MEVALIQATEKPIETIATIASICYDSKPSDSLKLVKTLWRNGHHSVFEHVYFTFKIDGISRACSHQLVRHRHCAFTQRSQRYCSEDGFGYVYPDTIKKYEDNIMSYYYTNVIDKINKYYQFANISKIPNEDARYILPNACETSLYMSCNLRELMHIANERLCSRAQWEIRELVQKMKETVPKEVRFLLVPKCQSGYLICNNPCKEK